MDKPTQYQPDLVTPPGDTLQETLEALGMSQTDFAHKSGLSEDTLSQILAGTTPITPEIAAALEKAIGTSAQFWLNRESSYQTWLLNARP